MIDLTGAFAALAFLSKISASFFVYLIIGVLPCFLWLIFYLKRDRHPEPKKEIIAVFILGGLMTIPAIAMETFLIGAVNRLGLPYSISIVISNLAAIALIEEFAKYFCVWLKEQATNQNRYLDEPVDFIIYMVVAALGFAAVENLMYLLGYAQTEFYNNAPPFSLDNASAITMVSIFRSISAILFHTLSSGIVGYYMAQAFCRRQAKTGLLIAGIITASALHGLYNLSIIKSEQDGMLSMFLYIPLGLILLMAIALYFLFKNLLKTKSICNMKIIKK